MTRKEFETELESINEHTSTWEGVTAKILSLIARILYEILYEIRTKE